MYQFRLVCAAVRYTVKNTGNVYVLPGVRHFSKDMCSLLVTYINIGLLPEDASGMVEEQGFLDAASNFLTRKEAWGVAEYFGQRIRPHSGPEGILFSEDLY